MFERFIWGRKNSWVISRWDCLNRHWLWCFEFVHTFTRWILNEFRHVTTWFLKGRTTLTFFPRVSRLWGLWSIEINGEKKEPVMGDESWAVDKEREERGKVIGVFSLLSSIHGCFLKKKVNRWGRLGWYEDDVLQGWGSGSKNSRLSLTFWS